MKIRVNHVGEYGAQVIYKSQIKFCKNKKLREELKKMLLKKKFTLTILTIKLFLKEQDQLLCNLFGKPVGQHLVLFLHF